MLVMPNLLRTEIRGAVGTVSQRGTRPPKCDLQFRMGSVTTSDGCEAARCLGAYSMRLAGEMAELGAVQGYFDSIQRGAV